MEPVIPYFLFSLFSTWLFVRVLIPQLSLRFLDQPNSRSSHSYATPRGGGIAFVVVVCAFAGIALLRDQQFSVSGLPLLALPLAVVGFIDDRLNLSSSLRYGVQLLTAVFMMLVSPLVFHIFNDLDSNILGVENIVSGVSVLLEVLEVDEVGVR